VLYVGGNINARYMKKQTVISNDMSLEKQLYIAMVKLINYFTKPKYKLSVTTPKGARLIYSAEEISYLKARIAEVPYIRIGALYYRPDEAGFRDSVFEKEFNYFLDAFLFEISDDKNKPIDYFSPGLSAQVGHNNLDIQENPESAALLYRLR